MLIPWHFARCALERSELQKSQKVFIRVLAAASQAGTHGGEAEGAWVGHPQNYFTKHVSK